jgi:hypothetical protein
LRRAGCDESQGYLHSRPVPREEFEQLVLKVNTGAVSTGATPVMDLPGHQAKS